MHLGSSGSRGSNWSSNWSSNSLLDLGPGGGGLGDNGGSDWGWWEVSLCPVQYDQRMLTGRGLDWGGNSGGLLNLGGLDLWLLSLDLSGSWGSSLGNGSDWGSLSNRGNSGLGDSSSWGSSGLGGSSVDGLGSLLRLSLSSDGGSLGGNS